MKGDDKTPRPTLGRSHLPLGLRHSLLVQRQILLRTGHVPEKIVQNLCAGIPDRSQKICAKDVRGIRKCAEIMRNLCGGALLMAQEPPPSP